MIQPVEKIKQAISREMHRYMRTEHILSVFDWCDLFLALHEIMDENTNYLKMRVKAGKIDYIVFVANHISCFESGWPGKTGHLFLWADLVISITDIFLLATFWSKKIILEILHGHSHRTFSNRPLCPTFLWVPGQTDNRA